MTIDRREHPRYPARFTVRVEVASSGDVIGATCLNISEGGMLLEMERALSRGESVSVETILSPPGMVFSSAAEVAWSLDALPGRKTLPGMGVRFTSMSRDDQHTLREAIAEVRKQSQER